MVTVTLYVPVANVVAFIMLGFCCVLVNEFGPFHLLVCVPVEVDDVFRFRVLPLHKRVPFVIVGVAGGFGLDTLYGLTESDGQLFINTSNLDY